MAGKAIGHALPFKGHLMHSLEGGGASQEPLIRQSASKNLSDWSDAAGAADPLKGTLLRIRADMRSRLADRNHQRFGWQRKAFEGCSSCRSCLSHREVGRSGLELGEKLRFEDRFAFLQGAPKRLLEASSEAPGAAPQA